MDWQPVKSKRYRGVKLVRLEDYGQPRPEVPAVAQKRAPDVAPVTANVEEAALLGIWQAVGRGLLRPRGTIG